MRKWEVFVCFSLVCCCRIVLSTSQVRKRWNLGGFFWEETPLMGAIISPHDPTLDLQAVKITHRFLSQWWIVRKKHDNHPSPQEKKIESESRNISLVFWNLFISDDPEDMKLHEKKEHATFGELSSYFWGGETYLVGKISSSKHF